MNKYDVHYYLERIGIAYQEDDKDNFIIVIPNEQILNVPPICISFDPMDSHGRNLENYSLEYKLPIDRSTLNIQDHFYGDQYQMAIASLGHIVICIDEQIWVYLPESFSELQKKMLKKFKGLFLEVEELYYVVYDENRKMVEARDMGDLKNNTEDLLSYVENHERNIRR